VGLPSGLVVRGSLEVNGMRRSLRVIGARPHSLFVTFDDRSQLPASETQFEKLTLTCEGREVQLGACLFDGDAHRSPLEEDPLPEPGDGRILFHDAVYDFRTLLRNGRVSELGQRVEQLPLVLSRQSRVGAPFRSFVSRMIYDLQVYRAVFDELDRNLESEPPEARERIKQIAVHAEYPSFCQFFDERLAMLADEVRHASGELHSLHGFFFRKQAWDLITSSEFLLRTNLKPRGYSGDSAMMRMIYENQFRGGSVFSRFMHRHPIETPAAQAVRNRRALLADTWREAAQRAHDAHSGRARVLSVACGPAWELRDVLTGPADFEKYEVVLLDQDSAALDEALQGLAALEATHGALASACTRRDSVRTMLHASDLAAQWGQFDLIYSMGLFDYLTDPVAAPLIARLYRLLRPGGELVIGNFHPRNPTRIYMEYWMDWVLCYRTEDELLQLAERLPGARPDLAYETSGCQLFLRVRRP
jgi:extracellular factor (EF) 3-hydroxypalmitic acid methyl ester biosynthesis protein